MGRRGAFFVLYHDVFLDVAGMLSVACLITQSTTILVALGGLVIWSVISEVFVYKLLKIPRWVIGVSLSVMLILFLVFFFTASAMAIPNPEAVLLKPALAVIITLLTMFFMLDIIEVLDLATRLHIIKIKIR